MFYFLSSTVIELGLDVSWWFLKKGTSLLYDGIVYVYDYSKSEPELKEPSDITDSVVIIENEEILDELREIKKMLNSSPH